MATYTFQVHETIIAGTHNHTWEFEEQRTNNKHPLPQGGNGEFLGRYPEISEYLNVTHKVSVTLNYREMGNTDDFSPNYDIGDHVWTFHRGGDEIIIHDIPRLFLQLSIR